MPPPCLAENEEVAKINKYLMITNTLLIKATAPVYKLTEINEVCPVTAVNLDISQYCFNV